jgi:hypothetical protein
MNRLRKITKDDILKDVYYDLEQGYGSVKNTFDRAKEINNNIKLDDVKKWMSQQQNAQIKGYRNYNSYVAPFSRFQYQMDIMDMVNLQNDQSQPRYALVLIDIFSKKGAVEPMRNKDNESVYQSLLKMFKTMGYPMSVYSDDDGAFKSKVNDFFKSYGITHITTKTHSNVAERFIRTLKNMIHDRLRGTDRKWEDMVPFVINKYNNTIHSSTGLCPDQAHNDNNRTSVAINLTLHSVYKRKYPSLKEGDKVKIYSKGKSNYTSRKETKSKWSEHIYTIDKIDRDMLLNKYYIVNGHRYNRHELLLID